MCVVFSLTNAKKKEKTAEFLLQDIYLPLASQVAVIYKHKSIAFSFYATKVKDFIKPHTKHIQSLFGP